MFSMRVRRPALKQKWTNLHSGLPIRDKRGGQGLTDPVYSQLFTSPDVSSDSSQLVTAVKQRAQQPLTITRPGRQAGIQKNGMQGCVKGTLALAALGVSNPNVCPHASRGHRRPRYQSRIVMFER